MKKRISRYMSNRTVILAIDSGGTKCEMLAVDAVTGDIIREVRHQADSLPPACRPKQNFGGAGRTAEMLGYCLDEMLDGLDFQKLLPTGNVSKEMVETELARHGLTAEDYQPIGEIDGVFYSQAMTWGIAISAGTAHSRQVVARQYHLPQRFRMVCFRRERPLPQPVPQIHSSSILHQTFHVSFGVRHFRPTPRWRQTDARVRAHLRFRPSLLNP